MKIRAELEWRDYLGSQRLHLRPVGWRRVVRYGLIAVLALLLACDLLLWSLGALDASMVKWLSYTWPVAAVVAGLTLLYYYAYLPWSARRAFQQQKEYSAPFELEITPDALISTSQYGYSNRPWGNFVKWKEDATLLLLYLSDLLYLVIPKRFMSDQQVAEIRARLNENGVTDASRARW